MEAADATYTKTQVSAHKIRQYQMIDEKEQQEQLD